MGGVIWSVDTATGARKGIVPVSGASWARALNVSGSGNVTVPIGSDAVTGVNVRSLTEPVSRTLVFEFNGTPIYAGIIWTRSYDRDSGLLTLSHTDLWSLMGKRLVAAYQSAGMQGTSLTYTNLEYGTQIKRAIQAATAGAMFTLPIVLPADVAGPDSRTYHGYHFPVLKDVIQDLMEVQYGPDVDFLPRWSSSGSFEWVLLAGVPTPALLVWNLTAKKDGAHSLVVAEDAAKIANHVIATGQGTEVDMVVKSAIHGASPYPALVKTVSFSQETSGAVVQAHANAELAVSKAPTTQWSFSVVTGSEYDVKQLRPGVGVRAYLQGDPWVADGFYHLRLIGFSGDLGPSVALEFQAMEAA